LIRREQIGLFVNTTGGLAQFASARALLAVALAICRSAFS
jgi:hypothetical protein